MPYKTLLKGEPLQVEIDADAPVFNFQQGLSRFSALQLPKTSNSMKLTLKTTIVGIYMPDAFVLYPTLTLLDESFQIIEFIDPELNYERTPLAPTQTMGWVANIVIPSKAQYVIVHTPKDKVGTKLYYKKGVYNPQGSVVLAGNTPVFLPGNWWDVYLPAVGVGRLRVELSASDK